MPDFDSDGVRIHYEVYGAGEPLVLVHGFAASIKGNWGVSGWIDTLSPVRQLFAIDCRGHGESEKPYDPAAYAGHEMTEDVIRMMDHVGVEQADLFGYSMGAGISLRAVVDHPERFRSVVLGGIGDVQRRGGRRPGVAEALLADDPSKIEDPIARGFRTFAEATKADRKALAAMQQSDRPVLTREQLQQIKKPVLVVNGADDRLAGTAGELVAAIPGARYIEIPGKEHLTVVADQRFKDAVLAFLKQPR